MILLLCLRRFLGTTFGSTFVASVTSATINPSVTNDTAFPIATDIHFIVCNVTTNFTFWTTRQIITIHSDPTFSTYNPFFKVTPSINSHLIIIIIDNIMLDCVTTANREREICRKVQVASWYFCREREESPAILAN
jgi:hypothetical protein